MKIETMQLVVLVADEGKTFARKEDNEILGTTLYLGINDSPDNYIEVLIPEELAEGEQ